MERICAPSNLDAASFRVMRHKGAAGVDGMSVDELRSWIATHKEALLSSLLDGSDRPAPVRGFESPKPDGNRKRQLGIPPGVDHLVQPAFVQVLQPILEPKFSDYSFGFRPPRSAPDALGGASSSVQAGYTTVVALDLEQDFDQGNHAMLRARWTRPVRAKRVLRITRCFRQAGLMHGGLVSPRVKGKPPPSVRWSALAAAGEPVRGAGRSGQGTGEARPSVRALR